MFRLSDAGGLAGAGARRPDPDPADAPAPPRRQRAHGRLSLEVALMGGRTGTRGLAESGSARLRFPRTQDPVPEAVIVNTAGGIASGDLFETEIAVGEGASLLVTTSSAERIYRSDGDTSRIATRARVAAGAALAWLPQETILFDRARLSRSLEVDLHPDGTALLFEATVFGRAARGESVREGAFRERWRLRRGGRLVYADTLLLSGDIAAELARPAVGGGGRALATLLYAAQNAELRLEEAREALAGSGSETGASAWNGLLAIRWIASDIATLRRDAVRFMVRFRDRPMPRVWMC